MHSWIVISDENSHTFNAQNKSRPKGIDSIRIDINQIAPNKYLQVTVKTFHLPTFSAIVKAGVAHALQVPQSLGTRRIKYYFDNCFFPFEAQSDVFVDFLLSGKAASRSLFMEKGLAHISPFNDKQSCLDHIKTSLQLLVPIDDKVEEIALRIQKIIDPSLKNECISVILQHASLFSYHTQPHPNNLNSLPSSLQENLNSQATFKKIS